MSETKTKTIYHPTAPGVTREVPESRLKAWRDQGWLVTRPKAWDDAPAPAAPAGATQS